MAAELAVARNVMRRTAPLSNLLAPVAATVADVAPSTAVLGAQVVLFALLVVLSLAGTCGWLARSRAGESA